MTRAECSYCRKKADKRELKRCSRCQYLLYCSKECQVRSWNSTHKYNCRERSAIHELNDKDNAREDKKLTSWLNAWANSLCIVATVALDLANHESDYLVNHCLYIQLKKTGHKTDARRFMVEDIYASHFDPLLRDCPELASMLSDPPELSGKRVRFLVTVMDHNGKMERARARVWTDRNIEAYREMSKEDSRSVATSILPGFVSAVATGDMTLIPKLMNMEER